MEGKHPFAFDLLPSTISKVLIDLYFTCSKTQPSNPYYNFPILPTKQQCTQNKNKNKREKKNYKEENKPYGSKVFPFYSLKYW